MPQHWFHVPTLPAPGGAAVLEADEARHAVGSKRLGGGERVHLFDGRGSVAEAVLSAPEPRQRETIATVERITQLPAPKPELVLAAALPKGERLADLLNMATQLGMTRFVPLRCAHAPIPGRKTPDRWRRVVIEACKQSRRAFLPIFQEPQTPAELAKEAASRDEPLYVAHPGGRAIAEVIGEARTRPNDWNFITMAVGPEGGFSEEEVSDMAAHGAEVVDLGPGILRIETAGACLMSWCALGLATGA